MNKMSRFGPELINDTTKYSNTPFSNFKKIDFGIWLLINSKDDQINKLSCGTWFFCTDIFIIFAENILNGDIYTAYYHRDMK